MPATKLGTLELQKVPISSLVFDDENENIHLQDNIDSLTLSLKTWGQVEPLVVQRGTDRVIGGNGRLAAMQELGWEECEIVYVDVTDDEARALSTSLNHTAQTSFLDPEKLSATIARLRAKGLGPAHFAHTPEQLEDLHSRLRARTPSLPPPVEPTFTDETDTSLPPTPSIAAPGKPAPSYPIPIILTRPQYNAWQKKKAELGISRDTAAFIEIAGLEE